MVPLLACPAVLCGVSKARWRACVFAAIVLMLGAPARGAVPAVARPVVGDDTAAALRDYTRRYVAQYGVNYYDVPLDAKAEFFEWSLWRYHRTPYGVVYGRAKLADEPGRPPEWIPGADSSTWSGALLAALSYKYAATGDEATLARIADLLRAMRLFQQVTGTPGYLARSIGRTGELVHAHMKRGAAPPGSTDASAEWFYWDEPAKGTYNQVVAGYAVMMMLVSEHLPPDVQQLAREDLEALVLHVVDHEYHVTDPHGNRTKYGDLTPVTAGVGVPFNAQVAYMIVATGFTFPPDDDAARERIRNQFVRLRGEHHAYYADPRRSLVRPQRAGNSTFIKGMNDRNHLMSAAFTALELERFDSRRREVPINGKFLNRMGQTMFWGMRALAGERNSLCNFMWAAVLDDRAMFNEVAKRDPAWSRAAAESGLVEGVAQLRRFRLDRFRYPGREVSTAAPQWVDHYRPDVYHWKCNSREAWQVTGSQSNDHYAAIDYLHAYWLMRYHQLDRHTSLVQHHAAVLRPTPALISGSAPEPPPRDTPPLVPVVRPPGGDRSADADAALEPDRDSLR